jgi:hypothetical protein
VHAAADAGILRGTESSHDSPLEESGFEPLVPLRPGRFSEHHSRVVTAPSSIRKAGNLAGDGQAAVACRSPISAGLDKD